MYLSYLKLCIILVPEIDVLNGTNADFVVDGQNAELTMMGDGLNEDYADRLEGNYKMELQYEDGEPIKSAAVAVDSISKLEN